MFIFFIDKKESQEITEEILKKTIEDIRQRPGQGLSEENIEVLNVLFEVC